MANDGKSGNDIGDTVNKIDVVETCKVEDFLFQFREEGSLICKASDSGKKLYCEHMLPETVEIKGVKYNICNAIKQYTQLE